MADRKRAPQANNRRPKAKPAPSAASAASAKKVSVALGGRRRRAKPAEVQPDEGYDEARALDLMDHLVRLVARAFYDPLAVVIVDALVRRRDEFTRDSNLAKELEIQDKVVRKKLRDLCNDMLIKKDSRGDARSTHDVFYVDYPKAIDMIKCRMHHITCALNPEKPTRKEGCWRCTGCHAEYSDMEAAMKLWDPKLGVLMTDCPRCHKPLERVEHVEDKGLDDLRAKFNRAMEPIKKLIAEIEKLPYIPRVERRVVQYDKDGNIKMKDGSKGAGRYNSMMMDDLDMNVNVVLEHGLGGSGAAAVYGYEPDDGPLPLPPADGAAAAGAQVDNWKEQPPWLRSKYDTFEMEDVKEEPTCDLTHSLVFSEEETGVSYKEYVRIYFAELVQQEKHLLAKADMMKEGGTGDEGGEVTYLVQGVPKKLMEMRERDLQSMTREEYEFFFASRAKYLRLK